MQRDSTPRPSRRREAQPHSSSNSRRSATNSLIFTPKSLPNVSRVTSPMGWGRPEKRSKGTYTGTTAWRYQYSSLYLEFRAKRPILVPPRGGTSTALFTAFLEGRTCLPYIPALTPARRGGGRGDPPQNGGHFGVIPLYWCQYLIHAPAAPAAG